MRRRALRIQQNLVRAEARICCAAPDSLDVADKAIEPLTAQRDGKNGPGKLMRNHRSMKFLRFLSILWSEAACSLAIADVELGARQILRRREADIARRRALP